MPSHQSIMQQMTIYLFQVSTILLNTQYADTLAA
jgi:hypothetical protein